MKVLGLLLAGGRSRRFGSEKAMAPYRGGLLMDAPLPALIGLTASVGGLRAARVRRRDARRGD